MKINVKTCGICPYKCTFKNECSIEPPTKRHTIENVNDIPNWCPKKVKK